MAEEGDLELRPQAQPQTSHNDSSIIEGSNPQMDPSSLEINPVEEESVEEGSEEEARIYEEFMANLTPCSSILTRCSEDNTPIEYNPIDVMNLLNKRNSLSKSGTLIENVNSRVRKNSQGSFEMDPDELLVKIFITNSNDEVKIVKLQELLEFINSNQLQKSVTIQDLTSVHLLIFLSEKYSVSINKLKLYHLGKVSSVTTVKEFSNNTRLIEDMKINKYPTMHLMLLESNSDDTCDRNPTTRIRSGTSSSNAETIFDTISIKESIEKSFEVEYYPVTYAEAIIHKINQQNLKQKLNPRFRSKVKTKFRKLLHI